VKVSVVTTNARAPGGQFVINAKALPDNPYDGHTQKRPLRTPSGLPAAALNVPMSTRVIAATMRKIRTESSSPGWSAECSAPSGELRRRSPIEAVIGHMKANGHLGRCYLKGVAGYAANAILSVVGHNLCLALAWLRMFLRLILLALYSEFNPRPRLKFAA